MQVAFSFLMFALVTSACARALELPPAEHRADGSEPGACTTSRECLAGSDAADPNVCVDGQCTPLLTPECPLVLPQTDGLWLQSLQAEGPEPLVVGAFTDIHVNLPDITSAFTDDYDLALTEVQRTLGGVPVGGGSTRPVIAVACKNVFETPDELDRAEDHLVNDLRVPGILATLALDDLQHAFERSSDAQVFFLNLRDADPSLVSAANNGLMWHMLTGWNELLPSYQALLDRTVRHLANTGALAPDEPVRVALIRAYDSPETNTLGTTLLENLVVNGATLAGNTFGLGGNFRLYDMAQAGANLDAHDYNPFIDDLRSFEPHVIIAATDDAFVDVVDALEVRQPKPAPFYILCPNQTDPLSLGTIHELDPKLYERVAGINFSSADDASAYDAFQARFDAAYPSVATRGQHTENQYDGPYYLLYAAAAARGSWPLAGPDLALGMRQLLAGDRYSVGPDDLPSAMGELKKIGASITLDGTMGPPNFDPNTGTRQDPGTVWCVDSDGTLHTDVLRVDDAGALSGTFPCFDFDN
jgi:hypothetical protein